MLYPNGIFAKLLKGITLPIMSKNNVLSELAFLTYRTVLTALTMIVVMRLVFDYEWNTCALYGIATVASFYLGQGIVAALQFHRRTRREMARQENDI